MSTSKREVPPAPAVPLAAEDLCTFVPALAELTPCQLAVAVWLAQGKTREEIGLILKSAASTVEKHLHAIYTALCVDGAPGAIAAIHDAVEDWLFAELTRLQAELSRVKAKLARREKAKKRRR